MKILCVISTLDLKFRLGCTPAWWQLLKALHETGNEVIATPYLGDPVQGLWWRTYPNPCSWESRTYNAYLDRRKKAGASPSKKTFLTPIAGSLIKSHIRPRWQKHLVNILRHEKGIDAVLVMNVPINHLGGIPSRLKNEFNVPVIYYDGDMPTSLPRYTVSRGFKFNYYEGADLSEYDAFLANSEGCLEDLRNMGAREAFAFQYGIDTDLASPVEVEKKFDVSFFGYGSDFREEWMEKMITIPSREMPDVKFAVAGGGFAIDLGKAEQLGDLSYSEWRNFCCRSRINLNITRWSHTSVYASSTSRPFELAAFGACIVSQPYNGLEKWFDIGKEMIVVNSAEEAIETYRHLLDSPDERERMADLARIRVKNEHTFRHRARQLVEIIATVRSRTV